MSPPIQYPNSVTVLKLLKYVRFWPFPILLCCDHETVHIGKIKKTFVDAKHIIPYSRSIVNTFLGPLFERKAKQTGVLGKKKNKKLFIEQLFEETNL